jgi:hypothetical protein
MLPRVKSQRTQSVRAGILYFAVVFAAGFVLGTARVVLLAPRLGELLATLVELPFMLGISWLACGKLIARFQIPPRTEPRLTMGAVAFALLMLAEVLLSALLFKRSLNELAQGLLTPQGMLGFAGQVLFALIPLVNGKR